MLMSIFIFLFRLKQVEIQIDPAAKTMDDVIKNLVSLKVSVRWAIWAMLSIKAFFIVCFTVINIIEIYQNKLDDPYPVPKIILTCINLPCNLILCFMLCYFYKMGLRFLSYFKIADPEFKAGCGKCILFTLLVISLVQLLTSASFNLYPTIMMMRHEQCQDWYMHYQQYVVYYFVSVQPIQGTCLLFVISFLTFTSDTEYDL